MTPGRIAARLLHPLAWHRMDLRGRLMWLAMLPVLVFAVVWGSYVIRQRDADLAAQLQQRAQLLARQLAVAADYGIFSFNQAALDNIALGVLRESSVISATIIAADGRVLATRHAPAQGQAIPPGQLQAMLEASRRGGGGGVSEHNAHWVAHLEPVRTPLLDVDDLPEAAHPQRHAPPPGHVIVQVSTRSIRTELFDFGLRVMVLLAGVLLSGWVMARRISTSLDQRIQAVVQAAQKIGAGHIGIRLPASAIPSFARLSQDINGMAEQLEQSRQRLEQRVLEATQALREQRDAAEQANRDKTRFLAAASHDLRQPLHAMGLFLDTLARSPLTAQQASVLGHARTASGAASEMLTTLLDYSRLEAGVVQAHDAPFAVQPLLSALEQEFGPQADAAALVYRTRETTAAALADKALVDLVMRNFISNALRYTRTGGLLIACRARSGRLALEVWDTGCGIAPEHQQEVFKEFHQLGNPERDRRKGLGLGLAIVQRLAQAMHTQVEVRSRLGRGSVFRLWLTPWRGALVDEAVASAHDGASLVGRRVLVVDDDEPVRLGMQSLLASWGCHCVCAESAADALARLHQMPQPDVVVTDFRLRHEETGKQVLQALRSTLGLMVPAIIMTGDTSPQRLRDAQSTSALLLHKPVSTGQLRDAITLLLQQAPAAWLPEDHTTAVEP